MAGDLLVRGGTLVDGTATARPREPTCASATGSSSRSARTSTPDGEPEIDAGGAIVAPGFIDCHTHYDPSVWWDPLVDPMPQHGVTTVVTGNCSLSLTPVRAADRTRAADVFGFIEDIPVDVFATGIPWTWESYAEWSDALRMHGTAVNIAALVGHSNLRVYVMGDDAWDRAATPDERERLGGSARRVSRGGRARVVDVVRRHRPARAPGAEPRRRRRRVPRVDRRARPRAGWGPRARVPAVDQGHRPPARRHRTRRPLVRRPRRGVHVEPARAEQPRPFARRALDRAGAPAACRRLPRLRASVAAAVQPERQLRPVAGVHRGARVEPAHPAVARREAPPTRRRGVARAGPHRLGQGRRRFHDLPGERPRPGTAHVGASRARSASSARPSPMSSPRAAVIRPTCSPTGCSSTTSLPA